MNIIAHACIMKIGYIRTFILHSRGLNGSQASKARLSHMHAADGLLFTRA